MPQLTRTNEPNASNRTPYTRFLFLARPCVNDMGCCQASKRQQHTSNGGFSPGVHLFPFRTESLSPGAPMVLPSSVGESVAANLTVHEPPLRLSAVEGRLSF